MSPLHATAPLLLACLVGLAPSPAPAAAKGGEELVLLCEQGATLTKSFSVEKELATEEESMTIDGEEPPHGSMGMERETTLALELVVTDELVGVEDGEVTHLRRTFDEVSQGFEGHFTGPDGEENDIESDGECLLVGRVVAFRLEDGEFVAEFDEEDGGGEGDEALLAGLDARFDLEGFLPADAVEEGDTWEVPLEAFQHLRSPGGEIPIFPEDMDDETRESFIERLGEEGEEDELDGEIEATFEELRERDGRRLAVISLAVDIESIKDRSESVRASQEEAPDPEEGMIRPEIESVVETYTWEGEGELVWDVDAGHLVSLDLELEITERDEITMTLSIFGEEQEMEQLSVMAGTTTVEVRFEE